MYDRRLECYETLKRLYDLIEFFEAAGIDDLVKAISEDFTILRREGLAERLEDIEALQRRSEMFAKMERRAI